MKNAEWLFALIQENYQRNPILVLVLSAIIILPGIALISFLVQARARRRENEAAVRAVQRRAEDILPDVSAPAWSSQAWLTLEGARGDTLPLLGQMIRIGRHADNDIRLAESSVHRYHAMIERTPEEDFVITDLSGKAGNGVRINGERTGHARLADGDVIELGRAKLKFECAPL